MGGAGRALRGGGGRCPGRGLDGVCRLNDPKGHESRPARGAQAGRGSGWPTTPLLRHVIYQFSVKTQNNTNNPLGKTTGELTCNAHFPSRHTRTPPRSLSQHHACCSHARTCCEPALCRCDRPGRWRCRLGLGGRAMCCAHGWGAGRWELSHPGRLWVPPMPGPGLAPWQLYL
jgi:hypothetical protein